MTAKLWLMGMIGRALHRSWKRSEARYDRWIAAWNRMVRETKY